MAKENKSRYAILGMLSTGPMSGYGMKKAIENSVANFWSESYGQIYPILKQLADEGLTVSHAEKQDGKPERYVYAITAAGRRELQRWLLEPIEYAVERNELLLKLFFGQEVSTVRNIEHVQQFRERLAQLLQKYTGIVTSMDECADDTAAFLYRRITLNYGLHRTRALIQWCDETIALLQQVEELPGKQKSGPGNHKGLPLL